MIPTLETERLRLRPITMDDWPDYLAMMQSERSSGLGGPLSVKMAWSYFCHDTAQWFLLGHGALMIEDRASAETLGQVAINHGPLFPEPELGWFVYYKAEGKGVAFEAARRLRDWARSERKLPTLVSYTSADNYRSHRLAERLGGVLDNEAARPEVDDLVFRHY